jgi:hypothetical protein
MTSAERIRTARRRLHLADLAAEKALALPNRQANSGYLRDVRRHLAAAEVELLALLNVIEQGAFSQLSAFAPPTTHDPPLASAGRNTPKETSQ